MRWEASQLVVDYKQWLDATGLIHTQPLPTYGNDSEDGILFLAYFYLLGKLTGRFDQKDFKNFRKNVYLLKQAAHPQYCIDRNCAFDINNTGVNCPMVKEGKYWTMPDSEYHRRECTNGAWTSRGKLRRFSRDNAIGVSLLSFLLGLPFVKDFSIWSKWTIWDGIIFEFCRGGIRQKIASVFLFIPILSMMLSCLVLGKERPDKTIDIATSGKMLAWFRLTILKDHSWQMKLAYDICYKMIQKRDEFSRTKQNEEYYQALGKEIKKQGTWAGVSGIYFQNPRHPINILMREMYE